MSNASQPIQGDRWVLKTTDDFIFFPPNQVRHNHTPEDLAYIGKSLAETNYVEQGFVRLDPEGMFI